MKNITLALLLLLSVQVWAQDKGRDHSEVLINKRPMDRSLQMSIRNREISARQRIYRGNFIERWANKIERKANKWSTKLEWKLNKAFHKTDMKVRKVFSKLG